MSVILAIDLGKYNQIPNSLSHTTPTPRRRRSAPFAPGRPSSARTCCDSPLLRSAKVLGYEVVKKAEAEPPVLSA